MRNKVLLAGVALVVGAVWWSSHADTPTGDAAVADGGADTELINRLWISKVPQAPKEKVDIFAMVDEPTLGLFQTTSAFEGDFSLFEWKRDDSDRTRHRTQDRTRGRMKIRMLQTDKTYKLGANVSRDGCGPFDLCVKLKGAPRGSKQYYSMEDWIIEPGSAVTPEQLRAAVRAQLDQAR